MLKYNAGKNFEKDVEMIYLSIYRHNYDSDLRCHESARIFYKVLKRFGYNVSVKNGHYLKNGEHIIHSWVEFSNINVTNIIETNPLQTFPKLFNKERLKTVIIPDSDERFNRYSPLSANDFLKICKIKSIHIDKNQVNYRSEVIFQYLKSGVPTTKE